MRVCKKCFVTRLYHRSAHLSRTYSTVIFVVVMNKSQNVYISALVLLATGLKLLLFPAYHSTDLEVHRHWKSLTLSLPLSKWYTDTSSQWQLDYPPLFAYFEFVLSQIIHVLHPSAVSLSNHGYSHPTAIILFRASVLAVDFLYVPAVIHFVATLQTVRPSNSVTSLYAIAFMLLSPGLTLVDNIHFQYNGLSISLLLLTLSHLLRNNLSRAALMFSLALNIKQTLLPITPAIALYLLSVTYHTTNTLATFLISLVPIAVTTILTFVIIWLPIYNAGGTHLIKLIFHRLFPFGRGLLHANWAANIWSPYATLDKILVMSGLSLRDPDISITRGIIGAKRPFSVLPNPTPFVCTALIIISITPCMLELARVPTPKNLLRGVTICSLSAFLFGWHVHEKAILLPLIPMAAISCFFDEMGDCFIWLSIGAQFSLLELVRYPAESMYAVVHFFAYQFLVVGRLQDKMRWKRAVKIYIFGMILIEAYAGMPGGHSILFGTQMEFIPIITVSLYSTFGIMTSYFHLVNGTQTRRIYQ